MYSASANSVEQHQLRERVFAAFNTAQLNQQEFFIICKLLLDESTVEDVSVYLNITVKELRLVESTALGKLREHFESRGLMSKDIHALLS